MKKITLSLFFLFAVSIFLNAQQSGDQVLMTIGGRDITLGEFERIYRKNNNDNVAQKQSVDEYLDMFINFKLKVIEAEEQGMDTASSFLNEFNSYKKQLAKPYLSNPEINDKLAMEAWERMKEEINASHIMVRLDENPRPEDTLQAYEKLMKIREKLIKGENFENLAKAASEDPSAASNGGTLGWFSTFRMVYDFETAAYNTPVGSISMPFRSRFGMHIIKVNDRRPALGAIRIAHIFVRAPESMTREEAASARQKAFALVDSLKKGVDFAGLAQRNTDDRSSAGQGGEIPWIQSGQMIPVFDKAAFALQQPGDFSEPVQSDYGWHIIKLLEKKPIGSFEEEKANIMDKMKSGDRAEVKNDAFLNYLKQNNHYKLNSQVLQAALNSVDSSLQTGTWTVDRMAAINDQVIFSLDGLEVKASEFADFLMTKLRKQGNMDPYALASIYYKNFEKEKIIGFEEDNLVNKYPDYKHILQEYHDGILLFDLTDRTVWSKAVKDTLGLESFYAANRQNYKWGERAEASIVTVNDSASAALILKKAKKLVKKNNFTEENLKNQVCPNDSISDCIEVVSGKYEKGDNQYVDATGWKKGTGKIYFANSKPAFVVITSILKPAVKELNETRGQVTADYQKSLEDKWIQELRNKYEIQVNRELLNQIKDE